MVVRTKESFYIRTGETSYLVPAGSVGVEKQGIYYFYDVTKHNAIGFDRSVCVQDTGLFSANRNVEDREVPISQVLKLISGKVGEDTLMQVKSL